MSRPRRSKARRRLRLLLAIGALTGLAAAYRFALRYRERVGLPHRSPVETSPADFGLAFEDVRIPAGDHQLAGWLLRATTYEPTEDSSTPESPAPKRRRAGKAEAAEPRPGIVVVRGWESNRGRTFAHVRYLHAAGFHCLVFDVRGHGDSPPETLPINVPEFSEDATAAARWLATRPEVSAVGVLGHSMGGAGVIVAASREPLIRAVVSLSAPADLVRMTRQTFTMAEMHIPELVAGPLALITAGVLMAPRRHSIDDASALVAARRYRGPLLLIHGAQDHGVPVEHLDLIAKAATGARGPDDPPVETLVLPEFGHRWLYEAPEFRHRVASFFAQALGGPVSPEVAAQRAEACVVARPPDPIYGFGALPAKQRPG
jgi:alpha-beta hydrolase superfamily lysophospholipase